MKVIKCKPYTVFTPKEMNPKCYAYRGSAYKSFATYEVKYYKWKKEPNDYVVAVKGYLHDKLSNKLWSVRTYCFNKGHRKLANMIDRILDKLDPIPF